MHRNLALVIICFLLAGAAITAQDDQYMVEVAPGATCSDILNRISTKYGIDFGYNPSLARRLVVQDGKIEGTLVSILEDLLGDDIEILRQRTDQVLLRKRTSGLAASEPKRFILLESESGLPIPDVLVYTDAYDQEALSDASGTFRLDMNDPNFDQLVIDRLGYDNLQLSYDQLLKQDTFFLQVTPIQVPEIVVNPSTVHEEGSLSATSTSIFFSSQSLPQSSLGIGTDLLRSLQTLAGVSAFDDDDTRLSIRGGNWDETLVILDGMPIYRTDHFFGIFSSINSQHARRVDLYRNNFPLEYSGKTAGLVNITGINKVDRWSGEADIGLLASNLHLNIPLHDRIQLSISGRTSHNNLADSDLFEINSGEVRRLRLIRTFPDFNFNDLNIRSTIQLASLGDLSINYFQSNDRLDNRYSISYPTRFADRFFTLDEALVQTEEWQNIGLSINHKINIGSRSILTSNLHYTDYNSAGNIKTSVVEREGNRIVINEGFSNFQDNQLTTWGGHSKISTKVKDHAIEAGLAFAHFDNFTNIVQDDGTLLLSETQSINLGIFSGIQLNFTGGQLKIGGRGDYYSATDSWTLSPRIEGQLDASDQMLFKGSLGINAQFVRGLTYENRFGQSLDFLVLNDTENYPLTKSFNTMLGAQWTENNWSFDLEFYRKSIDGVAEYSLLLPGFAENGNPTMTRNFRLFLGSGNILGADLQFSHFGENHQMSLAYTLSKNTNSFPDIQRGREFLARNDRRHQLKYSASARIADLSFNAAYIFTSGRRYLDLTEVAPGTNRGNLTPNSSLPDYHRVDIGISYDFHIGKSTLVAYGSIFNLLDRENVKYLQYVFGIPISRDDNNNTLRSLVGAETNLLSRTFNFGVKFKF